MTDSDSAPPTFHASPPDSISGVMLCQRIAIVSHALSYVQQHLHYLIHYILLAAPPSSLLRLTFLSSRCC